jgi:hypothetical protein
VCCRSYRGKHFVEAVAHRVIGESQDAIPGRLQNRFALGVLFALLLVNAAVELDGQSTFRAAEIDDERANCMLSAELQPVESTTPKRFPQVILSPGFTMSQIARGRDIVAVLLTTM